MIVVKILRVSFLNKNQIKINDFDSWALRGPMARVIGVVFGGLSSVIKH